MQDYFVHETAEISKGAVIGRNTKIWHQSQIREGAKIGENCIISKCVYIDFDVPIGNNVKIQNGVSVYHGVEVEDDVFLGPHMTFTNDLYPRAFNSNWELVKTLVKRGASIGANATIVCGITIGEYAMIGSGAVVTKSVPDYGLVFGNPAKLKGFVCKCGRKAVKIGENNNKILMECTVCKTTFSIKEEDYLLLEED